MGDLPRYWLMAAPDAAAGLWNYLTSKGATPVGATAMDAVRVNSGLPEYGPELGRAIQPVGSRSHRLGGLHQGLLT